MARGAVWIDQHHQIVVFGQRRFELRQVDSVLVFAEEHQSIHGATDDLL
jgi:hypothetical protein